MSPKALEWVEKENNLTVDALDALPDTEALLDELVELAASDVRIPGFYVAGQLFRLRTNDDNTGDVLERAEIDDGGPADQWQEVIDIGALSEAEGKEFSFYTYNFASLVLGEDGSRLLLQLTNGGSDLVELREVDVEKGELVADGFSTDAGRLTVAWLDEDHVLINQGLTGGPTNEIGEPTAAYIWERGTPLEEATPVHSGETTDALYFAANYGTGEKRGGLIKRYPDFSTIIHYQVSLDGTVEEIPVPTGVARTNSDIQTSRHLILALNKALEINGTEYPDGTVIAYDMEATDEPAESRITIVHAPEKDEFNPGLISDGMRASASRVYLTTTLEGSERRLVLEYDSPTWKVVQTTPTEEGLHAAVTGAGRHRDDVVVHESGYLQPAKCWLENAGSEAQHAIAEQASVFNGDDFAATSRTATSKDGTQIDYLLLSPAKPSHPEGELPLLVTGYGGFGISLIPGYLDISIGGISIVPWLKRGGALAVAYVRGGGERGEAWHRAAMRENRQLAHDDFIAVAESLVEDGITTPEHMGVFGTSQGGLLAAVAGTQRPDLYGAVVSDAPLADMLRYHLLGQGRLWVDEYGTADEPGMEAVLHAYSPFHNFEDGKQYPPFMSITSTTDDRVGAGHSRKLIARIKEAGPTEAFFYEDKTGGHGVSDPIRNAELMARRMAFFIHYLM